MRHGRRFSCWSASALCLSCERAPVKPMGWVAFAMLSYSVGCLLSFNRWARAHVAEHMTASAFSEFTVGSSMKKSQLSSLL